MGLSAGELDRRITIEVATKTPDASNDVILNWAPWPHGLRWAKRSIPSGYAGRGREVVGAQQVVRDADTVWVLRFDTQSREIAPESHRVVYRGAIYEIVGVDEGDGRRETISLLCCSRPDKVGARGSDVTSDGSP